MPRTQQENNRIRSKQWYQDNKKHCAEKSKSRYLRLKNDDKFKAQRREVIKNRCKRNKDNVAAYKQGKICNDCGYSNPIALQFHHRDPKDKKFELSRVWNYSWNRILREIDKCDILCANCHLIRHCNEHIIT